MIVPGDLFRITVSNVWLKKAKCECSVLQSYVNSDMAVTLDEDEPLVCIGVVEQCPWCKSDFGAAYLMTSTGQVAQAHVNAEGKLVSAAGHVMPSICEAVKSIP